MQQGGNRQTEKLMLERSVPGRVGVVLPKLDVPAQPLPITRSTRRPGAT
ncbi:MAG: hypothetical protein Ct9H300mP11_08200 [Chloroflexota bacterium]|nr:MAG: hypothetical protein Ct9H300mP11_08200 [Chloroflexota bacterium]